MGRRGVDASLVQHLDIFIKWANRIVFVTNDGCAGRLVQGSSTGLRTIGRGLLGQAYVWLVVLSGFI